VVNHCDRRITHSGDLNIYHLDNQNQSYLYLGTLIPFKLKVRSYISSVYFSLKYCLRMGQHSFRKMFFSNFEDLKKYRNSFHFFSCHILLFRIKIVAFDAFLQGKKWYLLSHIGTYSAIPTSYVWDKRLHYLFWQVC
jgi:hypothetical protein